MTRRLCTLAVLAVLLTGAGVAVWRSTHGARPDPAGQLAAQLRCPACDGESVAQSRSPVAAGMRAVIAEQLAAGRTPAQVKAWFIARYGTDVLAEPSPRGVGALLWIVPALVVVAAAVLAGRALRRRAPPAARGAPRPAAAPARRPTSRVWDIVAVGLVAMVTAVAVGAHVATATAKPVATASADPVQVRLALGQSLEQQGQYATAADVYREAVNLRPADDDIRLKLAFALVRAGQADEAAATARQVLGDRPDDPDGLLLLGLAQRAAKSPDAAATLRRFLDVAPQHPAAAEVRRLLGQP